LVEFAGHATQVFALLTRSFAVQVIAVSQVVPLQPSSHSHSRTPNESLHEPLPLQKFGLKLHAFQHE
jgi:hypothetical protein